MNCNCSANKTCEKCISKKEHDTKNQSANNNNQQENGIKTITAEQLLEKMKNENSLTVINVLSQAYYNKCHIKDSINIPVDQLQGTAKESWDTNDEIVVYCANDECPLSRNAYSILKKLGFTHILAYEGGIAEWSKKGYPTVGDDCTF